MMRQSNHRTNFLCHSVLYIKSLFTAINYAKLNQIARVYNDILNIKQYQSFSWHASSIVVNSFHFKYLTLCDTSLSLSWLSTHPFQSADALMEVNPLAQLSLPVYLVNLLNYLALNTIFVIVISVTYIYNFLC